MLEEILSDRIKKQEFVANGLGLKIDSQTMVMILEVIKERPVCFEQVVGYITNKINILEPKTRLEKVLEFVKEVKYHNYKQAPEGSEFYGMEIHGSSKHKEN